MRNGIESDWNMLAEPRWRYLLFFAFCAVFASIFYNPLRALIELAFRDDRYTPTLAVPLFSVAMAWMERKRIFRAVGYAPAAGGPFLLGCLVVFGISALRPAALSVEGLLSIRIFALLLGWVGAFFCCYGIGAGKAALFPLAFLVLMIPAPAHLLEMIVVALQRESAELSYRLFKLAGVPVFRDGIVKFTLPGVTIEVAEQCSGIRSSLSLFISSLVAGYLLLRSSWSRIAFSAATIPIVIFKNAVRIVTISLLGVYVDPGFLHGRLHHYGGLPFSLLALALLTPLLFALIRADRAGLAHTKPRMTAEMAK